MHTYLNMTTTLNNNCDESNDDGNNDDDDDEGDTYNNYNNTAKDMLVNQSHTKPFSSLYIERGGKNVKVRIYSGRRR